MKTSFVSTVLIAAPAGMMSSSLGTFLRMIPQIKIIAQTEDLDSTLQALQKKPPHLLLFDADLAGENLVSAFEQFFACSPLVVLIVLVNNVQQQHCALQAGAKGALLKGHLDEKLRDVIRVTLAADPSLPVVSSGTISSEGCDPC